MDTYAADCSPLLTQLSSSQCEVIGPCDLVALFKNHMHDVYLDIALPGQGLVHAIRRYVEVHHEAAAFELTEARTVSTFFVNLGLATFGGNAHRLTTGTLRPLSATAVYAPTAKYVKMKTVYDSVKDMIRTSGLFEIGTTAAPRLDASTANDFGKAHAAANQTRQGMTQYKPSRYFDQVYLSNVRFKEFILSLQAYFQRQRTALESTHDLATKNAVAREALQIMQHSNTLIDTIIDTFSDVVVVNVDPSKVRTTFNFDLPEVFPAALTRLSGNLCVLGDAGAGKTSLAKRITNEALKSNIACIYVPCSRIVDEDITLRKAMMEFLRTLSPRLKKQDIKSFIEKSEVIVLDGYDEAATFGQKLMAEIERLLLKSSLSERVDVTSERPVIPDDLRKHVVFRSRSKSIELCRPVALEEIQRLVSLNKATPFEMPIKRLGERLLKDNPRVVLTSRDSGKLVLSAAFNKICLMPFSDRQLTEFFKRWFANSKKTYKPIIEFLDKNAHIKDICRTPMIATIVAALYENDYDLPESRVDVYEKRFDLLLGKWDRMRGVSQRSRVKPRGKLRFLTRLAMKLHFEHRRRFTAEDARSIWQDSFQRHYEGMSIEDVLDELRLANNVIFQEDVKEYSLGHLSYQEFLAALGIVYSQSLGRLQSQLLDPWWRQVLIFYAGIAGDITPLINMMQKETGVVDKKHLLDALLNEAKHASTVVHDLIEGFEEEGLLGCADKEYEELVEAGSQGDSDEYDQDDEEECVGDIDDE
jgi:hypothetical protein